MAVNTAKLWQLRVREGNAVRDTIDIGVYTDGGSYADEQLWLWESIARLAADRHKQAQVEAKQQSAADRRKSAKIAEVRQWLTDMGMPGKHIERICKMMNRYNEDHMSWDLFREVRRVKAQSSSGTGEGGG